MSIFNHKPAHTCSFSRSRHSMKFPRFIHKPFWPAATRHSARCLRLQQTQPHWLRPASFPMETKIEHVKKKNTIFRHMNFNAHSHGMLDLDCKQIATSTMKQFICFTVTEFFTNRFALRQHTAAQSALSNVLRPTSTRRLRKWRKPLPARKTKLKSNQHQLLHYNCLL